jgi:hypothetical protein
MALMSDEQLERISQLMIARHQKARVEALTDVLREMDRFEADPQARWAQLRSRVTYMRDEESRALPPEIRRIATTGWTVLDLPNWKPLENVFSLSDCAMFMYMGTVTLADGTTVEQYKHRNTRRYLNLDAERQAYRITFEGGDPFTEGPTSEQSWAESVALADAIEFAQS